ncbi:MAG TPA: hypothetical protein VFA74_16175 [Terriglobales bacterium]|nr:hypothetical protein [Terriglobales bacterium]
MKIIRKIATIIATIFVMALLTSAALFLLGLIVSLAGNKGWIYLGESLPWLPLIGLEYGFVLGIIIGMIVVVKKPRRHPDGT